MYEMNLTDGLKLLRDYAEYGDEAAFRKLVEQYIDLVYSAAMRRVGGDASLAQDVTQTVFTDLARKAESLRRVEMLGGWLHRHTVFVASNIVRGERRRQVREQEAAQMNATSESPDALWQQLAPVLDDTIESLEPDDRQAVLLRFFERRDFRSIGAALGVSDDAAQKRVSRALEKLRALLTERGVTLSLVLLSGLLAGKVIAAAPAGLAGTISSVALSGAAGGGLGVALIKLSKTIPLKTALAAIVAAMALWLYLGYWPASTTKPEQAATPVAALIGTTNRPEVGQSLAMATATKTADTNVTGKVLLLNIVTADSGKPVPDVDLDYWLWEGAKVEHKDSLQTTRLGVCKVPVPDGTTELILVSQKDGFADTLLEWHPDRGEQIPAQYTLQVARAAAIGGQVVDPDGNPVEGAEVGFNNQQSDPASEKRPQSDNFNWPFWVTAKTDAQGRWQINRIGKEAINTIYGGANHPDFVGSASAALSRDFEAKTQMLAGTYVFKLNPAITVRGLVKGPDGQPIPNADVLVGHVAEGGAREAQTGSDGTFSIKGCKPDERCITAEAEGYAPASLQVELTNHPGPYELVLQPGKLFRLRVVDEDGNPVPGASIWLDTFRNGEPWEGDTNPSPQVYFSRKTDTDGRIEWTNAPDQKMTFTASAAGYMNSGDVTFQPDGTEHVITLGSSLTISGTVNDATTGQPVPRFRIAAGWPQYDPIAHTTNVSWSTMDRFWMNFNGGTFNHTYDEPVVGGDKDPGFMFKFEADGYAPFITRLVHASDHAVRFDVALQPAAATEVTVFAPDGGLAAGVDIGLVSQGARLSLVPGGFSHDNIQSSGTLLETDNQGQFALPPDPEITQVVVAASQGYAEVAPAELATNPVITLLPWGRLEGTYSSSGQPLAGRTLSIQYAKNSFQTITCDSSFQTKTDNDGHFIFSKVPPGNHEVTLIVPFHDNFGHDGWSEEPLQPVTIQAGEATTVTIDETNTMMKKMLTGN